MIIVDLIYNLTLLVALSVVSGFIDLRWSRDTRSGTLLQGALFGGAALIAMLRPLNLGPGLIFDGRSVVVSLSGLFFGPWAAALASLMTIALRLALGGSGTLMGVLVILSSALIGVVFQRRWQVRHHNIRASQLWLFGLLVHLVMLALTFTLPNQAALAVLARIGWPVILTYPVATVLIGKILSDQAQQSRFVAELKHSEERFRTVADFTYDWEAWRAPDGTYRYVSPACERIAGRPAAEFVADPNLVIQITHPDDQSQVIEHYRATAQEAQGQDLELDFRIIRPDGETRWIGHSCTAVYGEGGQWLGRRESNRDITERQRAEAALQQSEAHYRLLADHMTDKIWLMDLNLNLTYASPSVEKTRGYTFEELRQLPLDQNLTPASLQLVLAVLADELPKVLTDPTYSPERTLELEFCQKDGSTFLEENKLSIIRDEHGRPVSILGEGRDITERKQLEQALAAERDLLEQHVAERTRELAAANARLQDLDRLKSKFVSEVSHELRTPVTSLTLYLSLLEHGKPDKRPQYLLNAQQQADRMKQLIEDILDLSRLERDKADLTLAPIDLNAVLEQAVVAQQPRAETAGLTLTFEPSADLPLVRGDIHRLLQVATNLITNAINYTSTGAIQVRSFQRDDRVGFEVQDTGMGIAPEDLAHLGQRFYRGQRASQSSVRGTGLGLNIVKEIVDWHGGTLEIQSEIGAGSTFSGRFGCRRPTRQWPESR